MVAENIVAWQTLRCFRTNHFSLAVPAAHASRLLRTTLNGSPPSEPFRARRSSDLVQYEGNGVEW